MSVQTYQLKCLKEEVKFKDDEIARLHKQLQDKDAEITTLKQKLLAAEMRASGSLEMDALTHQHIDNQKAEIEQLRAALKVYADKDNFAHGNDWVWFGDDDPTELARAVLAQGKEQRNLMDMYHTANNLMDVYRQLLAHAEAADQRIAARDAEIAAAPDLLEMLKTARIFVYASEHPAAKYELAKIDAVIKKAEGAEP